jgi:cytochrome bd-type quinol oxidase subunit 2
MTAGLPGVGIGGIFYLVSALLMPVRSLAAVLRGRADEARWPTALRQAALAGGILGALWLTGLALGWVVTHLMPESTWVVGHGGRSAGEVRNLVRTSALALSLGTLGVVLGLVQLLRVLLPAKSTERDQSGEMRSAARPAA